MARVAAGASLQVPLPPQCQVAIVEPPKAVPSKGTLVFLHGWPDSVELWAPTQQRFASLGYKCAAVGLPGFGSGSKKNGRQGYTFAETDELLMQAVSSVAQGELVPPDQLSAEGPQAITRARAVICTLHDCFCCACAVCRLRGVLHPFVLVLLFRLPHVRGKDHAHRARLGFLLCVSVGEDAHKSGGNAQKHVIPEGIAAAPTLAVGHYHRRFVEPTGLPNPPTPRW